LAGRQGREVVSLNALSLLLKIQIAEHCLKGTLPKLMAPKP